MSDLDVYAADAADDFREAVRLAIIAARKTLIAAHAAGFRAAEAHYGQVPAVADLHARSNAARAFAAKIVPEEGPFDV